MKIFAVPRTVSQLDSGVFHFFNRFVGDAWHTLQQVFPSEELRFTVLVQYILDMMGQQMLMSIQYTFFRIVDENLFSCSLKFSTKLAFVVIVSFGMKTRLEGSNSCVSSADVGT